MPVPNHPSHRSVYVYDLQAPIAQGAAEQVVHQSRWGIAAPGQGLPHSRD